MGKLDICLVTPYFDIWSFLMSCEVLTGKKKVLSKEEELRMEKAGFVA
jgi:hypothetical protein